MGVYCDTVALHSSLALCYLPALSSISILFNSLNPPPPHSSVHSRSYVLVRYQWLQMQARGGYLTQMTSCERASTGAK